MESTPENTKTLMFWGTFSGAPRECPEAYLDEIEAYADLHENGYGRHVQGKGAAKAVAQAVKTSAFLQGLGRDVLTGWYWDLPARSRDWETLQVLFRAQFRVHPPRVSDRRVSRFARQTGEALRTFLGRTRALAALCNPAQAPRVRDTFYRGMDRGDRHDSLVLWLVDGRLVSEGLLAADGTLTDACTLAMLIDSVDKTLDSAELARMLRDPNAPWAHADASSVSGQYADAEADEADDGEDEPGFLTTPSPANVEDGE